MSEKVTHPLAHAVDAVIEEVVARCPDPRAGEFKRQFDESVAAVREQFDEWKRTALADRKAHHETCGLVGQEAERAAEADVARLSPGVVVESEQLIAQRWSDFLRRLQTVLEGVEDEE